MTIRDQKHRSQEGLSYHRRPIQPFALRLPARLHASLRVLAATRGVSLNALLLHVVERWWEGQPERRSVERLAAKRL